MDRSIAPAFLEPKIFELPRPELIELGSGYRFFSLNSGDQPVIKIEFIFRAGSWFEAIPGLAHFSGKMLLEGTKNWSSKQIANKLDNYGAFVEVKPGMDFINLSIHIPSRHFAAIELILSEILFYPTFPDAELKLMKQIQVQQIKVNQHKNSFVASRIFRSKLFGNQGYGKLMTEDTIGQIKKVNLQEHFETMMDGRFEIFLTGQFDDTLPERIIHLVKNRLKVRDEVDGLTMHGQDHFEVYKDKKGSLQSSIYMGSRMVNKHDSRFPKLLLLNEVFGGYFGSRLMQNIREDKGFTYSIYSHLVSLKEDAYFLIRSEVKKDKKEETIEEIYKEIEKLKSDPIDQDELEMAKNYLKGSILNALTTPFAITEKWKNIHLYGLDDQFYVKLFEDIDATNRSELMDIANELLFRDQLSSVVVG